MHITVYDFSEGDESNLIIVVRRKDESLVDLTGASGFKLHYVNAGAATVTRTMVVTDPKSSQMAYRFTLNELKPGDLEVSGEFTDSGGFRHTQPNSVHLKVGPRP